MTEERSLLNASEDEILRTPKKPPPKSRNENKSFPTSPLNLSATEFHSSVDSNINDDDNSSTQPLLHTMDTESNNANTSDFTIAPIDASKANRHVRKK